MRFCDQLVTGPLWRLAENCKHVLDTCDYSLKLKLWFEECIEFPASFFDGVSPVPNLQVESPTTSALLFNELKSILPSKEAQDAAATVSNGSLEYFCTAFGSFLPEGEFSKNADLIRDTTEAAPATNKDIESVFGVISHIFETKPNMRLSVRIAQTLMTKNHTLNWLRSLTEDELNVFLNESRKARGELKIEGEESARKVEKESSINQPPIPSSSPSLSTGNLCPFLSSFRNYNTSNGKERLDHSSIFRLMNT
ncbi:unnamed protein product [Caenorhabditis brenneri]